MSFKSIILDVKGEIDGISRNSLWLRSNRAVHDNSVTAESTMVDDASKQSCWEQLPPELLRDVLTKIEDDETWPTRKNVVACAGVCKTWRAITREIVMTPEISGKITFPISLKQPGPRDSLLQCFIKRNRTTKTYHLYLGLTQAISDNGKFLLAARRRRHPTCRDYIISLDGDVISKGSNAYIGKLRSNFIGTKFVVYDAMPPHSGQIYGKKSNRLFSSKQVSPRAPVGNYPVARIGYELNVLGSRGPRRMNCVMDAIPVSANEPGGSASTQTDFPSINIDPFPSVPFFRSKSSRRDNTIHRKSTAPSQNNPALVLQNRAPRWHEQLRCWCLNFCGRVTVASVKNFQLVALSENVEDRDKILLQFGKVGKDLFTMDYRYPLSAFQAFAICLSSFDTKIGCE
ncbi:Tubby protein [Zostera marina]|uniref:Tubby protein n=1 Tax=Zostera marina TaxID=29655 RepID=A0A0K9P636_ZOSMR|nr:Tubby protein [Zostera marina]